MKITIKHSTIVKPAAETPKHILWNSNIDLVIPRIHIPTVYFYKGNDDNAMRMVFECGHLRESLGRALVPFYPMAGRLKDKGGGRVDIDCNGEGALFVEANADGCMSEYGEFYAPCMRMRQLVPHIDYSKGHSSFPLLILQVTFFKCGGVSMGVGVHHHVADGLAALRFLNYWADVARGFEEENVKLYFNRTLLKARDPPMPKFRHIEYQQPPPLLRAAEDGRWKGGNCHHGQVNGNDCKVDGTYENSNSDHVKVDGHCSRVDGGATEVNCESDDHVKTNGTHSTVNGDDDKAKEGHHLVENAYKKANGDHHKLVSEPIKGNEVYLDKHETLPNEVGKVAEGCEKHRQSLEEFGKAQEDRKDAEDYGPISAELFIFSQEQVNSLKKQAAECALPTERPFTSYEVLSAHIWRCACLARGLQDQQLTKLYIATDGRSRLQPALPPDYFGNVIFTATPVERVDQIIKVPLVDAARHIRKTVQAMDDEYLRSAIDYLELQPNLAEFSRGAHTFRTPNLGITSWVRLPIYGADFGCGPPLSMGPAGVPFEGLAYLLPGPPGDTRLRLSVTFSPDHMLHFQELIYQI